VKTQISIRLALLKNILDGLPVGELSEPHQENLRIARHLADFMLLTQQDEPEIRSGYIHHVKALLAGLEVSQSDDKVISTLTRNIDQLSVEVTDEEFHLFQSWVAQLQGLLVEIADERIGYICKELARLENQYASTLRSRTASLWAGDPVEAQSGAVNVKTVDEKALLAFIKTAYPEEDAIGIEKSEFISGGHSKFTLALSLTGTDILPAAMVLRGEASNRYGGAGVKDEYRLLKVLYEQGVEVPKPLALEESGQVFGAPFLLSAKARGGTIGHMFQLPETRDFALCSDVAQQLARIHRIPVAAFGDWIDNAAGKTSDKVHQWLSTGYRDLQACNLYSTVFETAFAWLRANAEVNDQCPRALVHGDYGLNNILIDDGRVTAILDWEFAHIGNPAYDLGYFYFMAESLGSWDHFLDAYQSEGTPLPDVEQLNYNILFAATRLGVMTGQSDFAVTTGQVKGAQASRGIALQYFNDSINRIYGALEKVL
jgi:aminoglycoside phosphotransferase (APT) family kinase protein